MSTSGAFVGTVVGALLSLEAGLLHAGGALKVTSFPLAPSCRMTVDPLPATG